MKRIVISGLTAALLLSAGAIAGATEVDDKGFAPRYVGAGVTQAFNSDASATEGNFFGAIRLTGDPDNVGEFVLREPVTLRGYVLPADGVEFGAGVSYDFGVAKDLNLYPEVGFVRGTDGDVFATVGVGIDYQVADTPVVLNANYKRGNGFGDEGFNLVSFGVGYQL